MAAEAKTGSEHPEDRIALPLRIEDVTSAWVGAALAVRRPEVAVRAVDQIEVLRGSATKIRLAVDYVEGADADLPATMILKGGFESHGQPVAAAYANEVRFYREVAARLPIAVPDCFYAGIDSNSGQAIVLLEDLNARGCRFGSATEPIALDTAAAALGILARLHASWWGPAAEQAPVASAGGNAMGLALLDAAHWERSLAGRAGALVPAAFRDRDRVSERVGALWKLDAQPPLCAIHGDAHLGNTYFDVSGAPGFLDWQTAQLGHWGREVTYFLGGALSVADRRSGERDLLAHYLDSLAAAGAAAPSFEEAWLSYRRHMAHGLLWFLCPVEMQPIEIIEANVERFAAAATDLGTAELF